MTKHDIENIKSAITLLSDLNASAVKPILDNYKAKVNPAGMPISKMATLLEQIDEVTQQCKALLLNKELFPELFP